MKNVLRKIWKVVYKPSLLVSNRFDKLYLVDDVPAPVHVGHSKWQQYVAELGNKPGMRILEVGSREVTGKSKERERYANAEYVGFDFYPGNNVDVVGDAHKLSSYFEGQQFDVIYTSACFEHFAMPWVVATEIAKLLKVGGIIFVETHFSFRSHERPWNFFQFSDMGLRALFPPAFGFECLDSGMSNPIVGRFSSMADDDVRNLPIQGLYCHSEFLGRKTRDVTHFDWANLDLQEVVGDTKYPAPKNK